MIKLQHKFGLLKAVCFCDVITIACSHIMWQYKQNIMVFVFNVQVGEC